MNRLNKKLYDYIYYDNNRYIRRPKAKPKGNLAEEFLRILNLQYGHFNANDYTGGFDESVKKKSCGLSSCICGKEIQNYFYITHKNGMIWRVGCVCVKKVFGKKLYKRLVLDRKVDKILRDNILERMCYTCGDILPDLRKRAHKKGYCVFCYEIRNRLIREGTYEEPEYHFRYKGDRVENKIVEKQIVEKKIVEKQRTALVFTFGKYKGLKVEKSLMNDTGYLRWLYGAMYKDESFGSPELRSKVRELFDIIF